MKQRLSGEQWTRIDFTVPSGAVPRDSEFIKSTEKIKQMLSAAQRQICLLTTGSKQLVEGPQCQQLKSNAQRSMNARLGVVMAQFRACQQAFVVQMQRNQELMSRRVSKAPTRPIPKESADPYDDPVSGQELLRYIDVDRSIQAERNAAIHQIADSVLYLKGILEQMNQMTLEQGTMLDRIDVHVQEAACFVAKAREHVERKDEEQKDFFVRKCILLALIGFIFVALLHIAWR
jgi:syntaxin 16